MLAVKLNELDGYRGKQISMIPQNPMTAFCAHAQAGETDGTGLFAERMQGTDAVPGTVGCRACGCQLARCRKIINSYPHELSGGTLQRVMIALTILQRPELIIADEITTAVDAASEYLILNELEKLEAGRRLHDCGDP